MSADERDEGEERVRRRYYEFVETKTVKSSTISNTKAETAVCQEKHERRTDYPNAAEVASTSSSFSPSNSTPAALHSRGIAIPGFARKSGGVQERHYGRRMRLYCRTGFCLAILPDGIVTTDAIGYMTAGVLEFSTAGTGEVRIRGVESNLYLAMSKKGIPYGEKDPRDYATVFVESSIGPYNTYLSQKYAHLGWYLGIGKNGNLKKAARTKWGQKSIQFLPIRETDKLPS